MSESVELTSKRNSGKHNESDLQLTITCENVDVIVANFKETERPKHILSPYISLANSLLGKGVKPKTFYRIKNISSVIRPRTMTLVLAPPGEGKSTYLKALSDYIKVDTGDVLYNGYNLSEAEKNNIYIHKLVKYVDQVDMNISLLTVRETLTFAQKMTSSSPNPEKVEKVIDILGLKECKDTLVGSAAVRGVSGGQRRRVTIGQALVSDARVFCMDEYTNGLDTATAEDITMKLRDWVEATNGSIVATLQQPTPGLYEIFDTVILMREGQIIFQGRRQDVIPFVQSMGYFPPEDVDTCDYLIDFLGSPHQALQAQKAMKKHQAKLQKQKIRASFSTNSQEIPDTSLSQQLLTNMDSEPCISTEQMVHHYKNSSYWTAVQKDIESIKSLKQKAITGVEVDGLISHDISSIELAFQISTYGQKYTGVYQLSLFQLFIQVWKRQILLTIRDHEMLISRLAFCILFGLIFGSLYWNLSEDKIVIRSAVYVISTFQTSYLCVTEVPIAIESNRAVKKEVSSKMYPSIAFASSSISFAPFLFLEILIFSAFVYFMTNQALYAGTFFMFVLIMFLQDLFFSGIMRMTTGIVDTAAAADSLSGPIIGIFFLFSNYFVPSDSLVSWLKWLLWVSPISWAVRGLTVNEYISPRYDTLLPSGQRIGDYYLESLGMPTSGVWMVYCIIVLFASYVVFAGLHGFFINVHHFELSQGTQRLLLTPEAEQEELRQIELALNEDTSDEDENDIHDDTAIQGKSNTITQDEALQDDISQESTTLSKQLSKVQSFQQKAILTTLCNSEQFSFTPSWLSFVDVSYKVKVKTEDRRATTDRYLLNNIHGYAEPGKLTALMGASGAGKTTLLDVLANRKNTGIATGSIKINGTPVTPSLLSSITGYVEQFDSLMPHDTVYETIIFAARLRLPITTPRSVIETVVDEVLEVLELTSIKHLIVGNAHIPGLSPSQLKRVNIGVELVANPAILFLDEPTTGLDSRSAQTVMRVVRRISRSGRSVICTIHQPSAELFYLFDRLLLLGSGGHQLYFGDLGYRSRRFVKYFSSLPGVRPIPARYNPATWMLEELGIGSSKLSNQNSNQQSHEVSNENIENIPEESQPISSTAEIISTFSKAYGNSTVYAHFSTILKQLDAISSEEFQEQLEDQKMKPETQDSHNRQSEKMDSTFSPSSVNVVQPDTEDSSYTPRLERTNSISLVSHYKVEIPKKYNQANLQSTPSHLQIRLIMARFLRSFLRDPVLLPFRFFILLFNSLLFGVVYWKMILTDQMSVLARMSSFIMALFFIAYIFSSSLQGYIMELRTTFYRERSSGFYKGVYWALALVVMELTVAATISLFGLMPFYFMSGLASNAGLFFQFYLTIVITEATLTLGTMFFCSIAPNEAVVALYQGIFSTLLFTFSGTTVFKPDLPKGYLWLYASIPFRYANEMMTMTQLDNHDTLISVPTTTGDEVYPLAVVLNQMTGFTFGNYWKCFGWITLANSVLLILATFFLHTLNMDKK